MLKPTSLDIEKVPDRDLFHTSDNGSSNDDIAISIVVPIYNERENITELYQNVRGVMEDLGDRWELVFVDDGSQDGSVEILKDIATSDGNVKTIQLRRNFGQTAALSAGFDHSSGRLVITMDGDSQNDPTDIPLLVEKLEQGYDIVSGWRRARKDPFIGKRLPSILSNKVASWFSGVKLHDYGCTLKAYRREVLDQINLYGELHRYIPAVASFIGVRVAEIEVKHHARMHGKSKYGSGRLVRGVLDLIALKLLLTYMTRPMQIFGNLGLITMLVAFASGMATILLKVFVGMDMTGNPLLYLTMVAIIAGFQFLSLGFLGEINIRTYHESQKKPIYVVQSIFGGKGEKLAAQ